MEKKIDRNKDRITPNDKATGEFIDTIEGARDLLKDISALLDEHLGFDPESINFAHVGTAEHIRVSLMDVLSAAEATQRTQARVETEERERMVRIEAEEIALSAERNNPAFGFDNRK